MAEPTLAELAKRLEAVEKQLAEQAAAKTGRKKDWRRVIGMFTGSEFMKQVDAEGQAVREADRNAAQQETPE